MLERHDAVENMYEDESARMCEYRRSRYLHFVIVVVRHNNSFEKFQSQFHSFQQFLLSYVYDPCIFCVFKLKFASRGTYVGTLDVRIRAPYVYKVDAKKTYYFLLQYQILILRTESNIHEW